MERFLDAAAPAPSPALNWSSRRRPARRTIRLLACIVALLLLAACGTDDQVLGLRPVPGAEGERIGAREVVLFDDAAALRDHVDEFTVALIIPGERVEEIGTEWLADRYADGIVIVALDVPSNDLMQLLGIPGRGAPDLALFSLQPEEIEELERRRRSGWDEPFYSLAGQPCEAASFSREGAGSAVYSFGGLRLTLDGILDRLDRECR